MFVALRRWRSRLAAISRHDELVPDDDGLPSWGELTKEQRCILFEGIHGHSLVDVLNAWVPDEDAPYWNRKSPYAEPLARAARPLVEMGLIEVWQEPLGRGEGGLMPPGAAAEAVSDPANWWRYDLEDVQDPDEDVTRPAGLADNSTDPMTVLYGVITTQLAKDLGLVRYPWR